MSNINVKKFWQTHLVLVFSLDEEGQRKPHLGQLSDGDPVLWTVEHGGIVILVNEQNSEGGHDCGVWGTMVIVQLCGLWRAEEQTDGDRESWDAFDCTENVILEGGSHHVISARYLQLFIYWIKRWTDSKQS